MRIARYGLLLALAAPALSASDVVVLRGGAKILLKEPPVVKGSNVLLTRLDGTLLSVPIADVDRNATVAAKAASGGPATEARSAAMAPATPAEAARVRRDGPRARVKLTDADVGHYAEDPTRPAPEEKDGKAETAGVGHVDVAEYTQKKVGDNLVVKGTLRNPGTTPAVNTRLSITAVDEKGQTISTADASLSSGQIDAGRTVSFTGTLPVGPKIIGLLRFSPQWIEQPPAEPAPAGQAASAAGRSAAPANPAASNAGNPSAPAPAGSAAAAPPRPPAPVPTPYGRGMLYAAPAPSAPNVAPADGSGYIPGAAAPENQPKTPN